VNAARRESLRIGIFYRGGGEEQANLGAGVGVDGLKKMPAPLHRPPYPIKAMQAAAPEKAKGALPANR